MAREKASARALVVEDQQAVRAFVSELLSLEAGAQVTEAATLAEAKELLAHQQWDVLITDMTLPDGDMLDALETLREQGVRTPPVVLMSGFLSAERMAKAAEIGIRHVLAKPFQPQALVECVRQVLPASSPHPAAFPSSALSPEVFEMDRKMGLMLRILHELPQQADLSSLAWKTLDFACGITHMPHGLLALAERSQQILVLISQRNLSGINERVPIDETPFGPLLSGSKEMLRFAGGHAPWPGVRAELKGIALPVTMQQRPVGLLLLLGEDEEQAANAEALQLLSLLLRQLDTLLDNRAVHAALADSMKETLIALVRALEARDRYTKDHSRRVGELSAMIARQMGLDEEMVTLVRQGGLLHDIGKVGIPDAVLLKPGRYTEREFAIMKAHPAIGDAILRHLDLLVQERMIVRHHHERFDGRGYPDKLAGEAIPLGARIVCVADAIDAMTTHRVYRRAQPLSFALEQLRANAGTQFDPEVAEAAIALIEQGKVKSQADGAAEALILPFSAQITVATRWSNKEVQHG